MQGVAALSPPSITPVDGMGPFCQPPTGLAGQRDQDTRVCFPPLCLSFPS